jgi:hypothetical protein
MAGAAALFTEALVAKGAPVATLVIHNMPTVITSCAIPLIQANVGTVRAVRVQDASDKREEVTQPALLKGCPYCCGPFAFTESVVTYMRMRNIFRCGCRMWVEGNTIIGVTSVELR